MSNFTRVLLDSKGLVIRENQEQPQEQQLVRAHKNISIQYGANGAEVVEHGVKRSNTYNQPNGLEGILGTARTPFGSPTSEIKDDSILELNGMTMRADIAARVGLIKKDPKTGRYL